MNKKFTFSKNIYFETFENPEWRLWQFKRLEHVDDIIEILNNAKQKIFYQIKI